MNEITFIYGGRKVCIRVNNDKYIYVNNNNDLWFYKRCVFSTLRKAKVSDFALANNESLGLLINGETIGKEYDLYYVDHTFSIEDDLKLGSDSLILKYFISMYRKNELNDYIQQLRSFLELISLEFSDQSVSFQSKDISYKDIVKLICPEVLKDNLKATTYDMSYEELIYYQLDLIKKIDAKENRIIVFIEIFNLSEALFNYISEIAKSDTIQIIVLFTKIDCQILTENVVINNVDLENDESLYERMMIMTNYYDLKDYKQSLKAEFLKVPL